MAPINLINPLTTTYGFSPVTTTIPTSTAASSTSPNLTPEYNKNAIINLVPPAPQLQRTIINIPAPTQKTNTPSILTGITGMTVSSPESKITVSPILQSSQPLTMTPLQRFEKKVDSYTQQQEKASKLQSDYTNRVAQGLGMPDYQQHPWTQQPIVQATTWLPRAAIGIATGIPLAAEKVGLFAEAATIPETRKNILPELGRAATQTPAQINRMMNPIQRNEAGKMGVNFDALMNDAMAIGAVSSIGSYRATQRANAGPDYGIRRPTVEEWQGKDYGLKQITPKQLSQTDALVDSIRYPGMKTITPKELVQTEALVDNIRYSGLGQPTNFQNMVAQNLPKTKIIPVVIGDKIVGSQLVPDTGMNRRLFKNSTFNKKISNMIKR